MIETVVEEFVARAETILAKAKTIEGIEISFYALPIDHAIFPCSVQKYTIYLASHLLLFAVDAPLCSKRNPLSRKYNRFQEIPKLS